MKIGNIGEDGSLFPREGRIGQLYKLALVSNWVHMHWRTDRPDWEFSADRIDHEDK